MVDIQSRSASVPVVAFEVLSTTASHAARKPAAHADREGSTPFADMLDKPANKAKTATKAPTPKAGKDKEAGKDASSQQSAPVKAKDGEAPAAETKAKAPETTVTTDAFATEPTDGTTTDAAVTAQDTAGAFLAAVADATGVPVAPVDKTKSENKTETKSDDTKADTDSDTKADKTDGKTNAKSDEAVAAAVPVTADTKSAPVAAVVTAPAEPAADAAPADATPAAAALTVAVAEQGIAKAAVKTDVAAPENKADGKTETKADAKTDKPQVTAKLDTPPLLTDAAAHTKQAANPQTAQPQQTQPQGLKPAADAQAQAAKPAPAPEHRDAPAADVAAIAKPADATQPLPILQNNGLAAPQSADQTATSAPAAAASQATALPVQGIAIEIAGRALEGKKTFDIRLDPPELGKIHVRLDVDHKGEVTSIITADRSDTFDMLRRDAQSLERALNDAGVKTSSSGLQFSLRDQGQQQNTPAQFADTARVVVRDNTLDTEITAPVYRPLASNRAGVDIRV
jgi:flagellar hook-length control protein FliK